MKPSKPSSPEMPRKTNKLVPLKQKFPKSQIKELPGWRSPASSSSANFKIVPSTLFKVNKKSDYYSPLRFATDNRLPVILEQKKSKSSSNLMNLLNKQTIELNYLKNNLIIESPDRLTAKKHDCDSPKLQDFIENNLIYSEKPENRCSRQVLNLVLADRSKSLSPLAKNLKVPDFSPKKVPDPQNCKKRRKSENLCEEKLNSYLIIQKISKKNRNYKSKSTQDIEDGPSNSFELTGSYEATETIELFSKEHSRNSSYLMPGKDPSLVNYEQLSSLNDNNTSISYIKVNKEGQKIIKKSDNQKKNQLSPSVKTPVKLLEAVQFEKKNQVIKTETENNAGIKDKIKGQKIIISLNNEISDDSFSQDSLCQLSQSSVKQGPDSKEKKQLTKGKTLQQTKNEGSEEEKKHDPQNPNFHHSNTQYLKSTKSESSHLQLSPINTQISSKAGTSNSAYHLTTPSNSSNNLQASPKSDKPGKTIKSSLKKFPTLNLEANDQPGGLKNSESQLAKQKNYGISKVSFKGVKSSSEEEKSNPKIKIKETSEHEQPVQSDFITEKNDEKKNEELSGKHKTKNSVARSSFHEGPPSQPDIKKKVKSKRGSKRIEKMSFEKSPSLSQKPQKNDTESEDFEESNESDEESSEISDDSSEYSDSESSENSYMGKTAISMRSGKRSSMNLRKNTGKKSNFLAVFKSFVLTEDQKKKGILKLDPVTNFIFNFSFNILNYIKAFSITSLKKKSKSLSKRNLNQKLNQEIAEKDLLITGKLKVNRPKFREPKAAVNSNNAVPLNCKKPRKQKIEPTYYSREINLRTVHSFKNKQDKINTRKSKNKEVPDHEDSDHSFDSNQAEEPTKFGESKKEKSTKLKKNKDLALLIAKQIIEANEENSNNIEESFCGNEEDIEEEILKLSRKLKKNTSEFAFGHNLNIISLQRKNKVLSFKEIEKGLFEPDMQNLIRYSEKVKFLQRKTVEEKQGLNENGKKMEVRAFPNEWMTEEQRYRERIKKIGLFGKKLEKRKDKLIGPGGKFNKAVSEKEKEKTKKRNWIRSGMECDMIRGTFEERVYFRLKGSASPIFFNEKIRFN